jgi:hypothetical protein
MEAVISDLQIKAGYENLKAAAVDVALEALRETIALNQQT